MSSEDLILGPPGVLPPGEWTIGARVLTDLTMSRGAMPCSGVIVGLYETGEVDVTLLSGSTYGADTAGFQLDLTTGALDHGTRALLHLACPNDPQPLTAPLWGFCLGMWWLEVEHEDGSVCEFRFAAATRNDYPEAAVVPGLPDWWITSPSAR